MCVVTHVMCLQCNKYGDFHALQSAVSSFDMKLHKKHNKLRSRDAGLDVPGPDVPGPDAGGFINVQSVEES